MCHMEKEMRISTIRSDLVEMIPFIIHSQEPQKYHTYHTRLRQRKIDLGNMIKILHSCRAPIQYTKLYQDSGFHYKEAFGLYIHFCSRFGLISRQEIKRNHNVTYTITPKGWQFYNMFVNEQKIPDAQLY